MKLYSELSVYRDTIRLLTWTYTALQRVAKMYRYTLLEEARCTLIDLLLSIRDVTLLDDKVCTLDVCRRHLAHAEILFTVLFEAGGMNYKQMVYVTDEVAHISKQLVAWQRKLRDRDTQSPTKGGSSESSDRG